MGVKDERQKRKTGNYDTRKELVKACLEMKEKGHEQSQISDKVGVSQSTVHRLINGDPQTASKEVIRDNSGRAGKELNEKFNSLWRTNSV